MHKINEFSQKETLVKTETSTTTKNTMLIEQKCIVVLNYVSCGKTALSRQMFKPAMNAEIVSIETINKDGAQGDAMSADKFRESMQKVEFHRDVEDKSVIVDVGVSNVELFLSKMKAEYAFDDFDLFFVPITPDDKVISNSIAFLNDLSALYKIPANKIRVIFNKMPVDEDVRKIYAPIFKYHENEGQKFTILSGAVVHESASFPMIGLEDLRKAAESTTDLRAAMKAAKSPDELAAISNARAVRRMAPFVVAELNSVAKILLA
ncbi:hypothetical protein [Polaromonas sp. DSP2-3-2b2]|uniref:hypothetical protein n=1 Tax=Polaromonas sp. DSP2-3-2b2 TaxID=2804662 RepID=UPI003CF2B76F